MHADARRQSVATYLGEDPEHRLTVQQQNVGYTHAETAAALGITQYALTDALAQLRAELRSQAVCNRAAQPLTAIERGPPSLRKATPGLFRRVLPA
jgi:hypothetical protein